MYPGLDVVDDASVILDDPEIDAVIIATPVATHYPLGKKALLADKHVLIEKPMTSSPAHARELVELAAERDRVLMAGHTFEYTAAVNRIRSLVESGELGDILYIRSVRVNLGLFQKDINVLWDLAPHDISILLYVLNAEPVSVTAIGRANVTPQIEDIVNMTIEFETGVLANLSLSWLDPRKVREMTIIGDRKMLVYDDVSPIEKIRIFDKGVDGPREYDSFGDFQYSYRYGDIVSPLLEDFEPLRAESEHFIECIRSGKEPRSSGRSGLATVRVLAAAHASLLKGGAPVKMSDPAIDEIDGVLGA
jgi:predicted dehydrogenase